MLTRFKDVLPKEDASDPKKIEKAFRGFCKDLKLKENRFVSTPSFMCDICTYNFISDYSVITWEVLRMLLREFLVKCPNPFLGVCQPTRSVKN